MVEDSTAEKSDQDVKRTSIGNASNKKLKRLRSLMLGVVLSHTSASLDLHTALDNDPML